MALAPTTWKAGREPSGRMGSTLADVCTSATADEQIRVDAGAGEQIDEHVAEGV